MFTIWEEKRTTARQTDHRSSCVSKSTGRQAAKTSKMWHTRSSSSSSRGVVMGQFRRQYTISRIHTWTHADIQVSHCLSVSSLCRPIISHTQQDSHTFRAHLTLSCQWFAIPCTELLSPIKCQNQHLCRHFPFYNLLLYSYRNSITSQHSTIMDYLFFSWKRCHMCDHESRTILHQYTHRLEV